jgi:glucuronoarabinoxylan endo-1,4-beta-xylanase
MRTQTTKMALIGAAALVLMAAPAAFGHAAPTITHPEVNASVNWNAPKQVIVGFGASGAFGQAANLESFPAPTRTKLLNLLFSTKSGIGLTVVRSLVNDGNGSEGNGLTIEPSPGTWDWSILPDAQIWLMRQAAKYGVKTFMATPWSPPAWMKANDSLAGGSGNTLNYLLPKYYHAYAVYLANYVNGYWTHFHIRITDISVQNEPDQNQTYASAIWTPEQFNTFIKDDLGPVFAAKGVKAKVIMPEQSFWGEQYALPTLNDPAAAKYVSIVAAHGYGGTIAPLTVAESKGKQVWETEYSTFTTEDPSITNGIAVAQTINQYLTVADVSVWNYWWLVNGQTNDNEGLINLLGESSYIANKRLFTMGNFSRFIRPGDYRIGSSVNPAPGISMSAYRNRKTGQFAVVVINANAARESYALAGLPLSVGSTTPYVTSASQNLAQEAKVSVTAGRFVTTLAPMSVTTFVGG